MKIFVKIITIIISTLVATGVLAYCEDYDSKEIHDGHLTVSEAISHYNCGKGRRVIVFAHFLTVYRPSPWNTDNWAKGVVQGFDFWVHGRVGMKKNGVEVRIQPEQYNFDIRSDGSKLRNIETITGRIIAGNGTPYIIVFKGSPLVITDGYTYGQ